jgi:GNAT superfamily N-acetyltransferase
MTFALRIAAHDDADLEAVARIISEVRPYDPHSADELRWEDRTYPGTVRVLAEVDGGVVGAATVGRIYVHPPDYPALWATLDVLPRARRADRCGAPGCRVRTGARARQAGLFVPASEVEPTPSSSWSTGVPRVRAGQGRELPLAGLVAPEPEPLPGNELTYLAQRPDLVEGIHAVALEAFADIPGGDEPITVGDLAEFRARDVDRDAIPPDAFIVAVERTTGRVVGYASLLMAPVTTRRWAWHDMTAVARDWRGKGLARSLKDATIRWAITNGLDALRTGNDVDNAPMRAINAPGGIGATPDLLTMRGDAPAEWTWHRDRRQIQVVAEATDQAAAGSRGVRLGRAQHARARGLAAPYIAGGRDRSMRAAAAERSTVASS